MRLMEILEEVRKLENGERLSESNVKARKNIKAKIKAKYDVKVKQALVVAKKLKARKNNISWNDDDLVATRNEIVAAFMANDADKVIEMMAAADGYKSVEILKALAIAHGGYKKLEQKAGNKKAFIRKVFAYIDENAVENEGDDKEEK